MKREFILSSQFGEIKNRLKALDARIAHHRLFLNKAPERKPLHLSGEIDILREYTAFLFKK